MLQYITINIFLFCMEKRWKVSEKISETFKNQFPEIDPFVLQLLYNRNIIKQQEIDEFLNPDYAKDSHSPFLFINMEKAVKRILDAKIKKEVVLVYGDYDADGVCATALMVSSLKKIGIDAKVYIPFRDKEGYGMNQEAIEDIIKQKVNLVITVDCGIANCDEASVLYEKGIDLIITDHHNPQKELPRAYAIINPKYPDEKYPTTEICGTAVAFKVAQALFSDTMRKEYEGKIIFPQEGYEKWFLDLVAIGTVTDMMNLVGESRTLVRFGLIVLNKTTRLGLRKLFDISGITLGEIDTGTIGFQIGPRLNAAGRMDHASTSYELLIGSNAQELEGIAKDLNAKNQERQKVSEKICNEAREQVQNQIESSILFAKSDSWSPSLVGLVAGKIMDEYFRPCVVIGKNHDNNLVGSGRSIKGFDITLALEECKDFLSRFGGHSMACGFTLKDISLLAPFQEKMILLAKKALRQEDLVPELSIDMETELHSVNWQIVEVIEKFSPFGVGNTKPKILIKKCKMIGCNSMGQNNKHLKGIIGDGQGTTRQIIGFGFGEWAKKLQVGDLVDIVCEPSINQWNGNREIQLKLIDLRLS